MQAEGLEAKVTILLGDYRSLPIPNVLYDKIVAIEMTESSGNEGLENFWQRIDLMLKEKSRI